MCKQWILVYESAARMNDVQKSHNGIEKKGIVPSSERKLFEHWSWREKLVVDMFLFHFMYGDQMAIKWGGGSGVRTRGLGSMIISFWCTRHQCITGEVPKLCRGFVV